MKNQNSLISLAYIKVSDNPLRVFCNYILYLLMKEPEKELRADVLKDRLLQKFGLSMPQQLINNCIRVLEKQGEVTRLAHGAGYRIGDTSFDIDAFERTRMQLHEHEEVLLQSLIDFVAERYKKKWSKEDARQHLSYFLDKEGYGAQIFLQKRLEIEGRRVSPSLYIGRYIDFIQKQPEAIEKAYLEEVVNGMIFDLDSECGKMFREPFPAESRKGRTSGSSSKNSSELVSIPFMSLDLTPGAGNLLDEFYWEILSPWRGESLILNTGPAPRSGAAGSTLWSILEARPHPRYFLTRKACQGIIRRASERGKPLPEQLKTALEIQAGLRSPNEKESRNVAFHINQRDEGIDLNGISGALMATRNMQMQTFVTQPQQESVVGFDGYNGDITGEVSATLGTNCGMSTGRNGIIQPQAFAANQRDEVRDLHGVAGALGAQPGMKQQTIVAAGNPNVLCLNDQGGQFMSCSENITGTLRSQMHQHQPLVLKAGREVAQEPMPRVYENHGIDSRYTGPYEVSPTISARCGTGGNNVPLVSEEPPVFCIVGNVIDREPENGGNGCGYKENIAYTLTAMDRHAVFSRQRTDVFSENNVVSTESARQHKDATDLVIQPYQETIGTLVKSDHKGISNQYVSDDKCIVDGINLIRRLTPLECERLQGFPDGWTNIPSASDSARYKALGNSVAIPCVEFVMQGLALALEYENEIRRRRRLWVCFDRWQRCAA